MQNLTQDVVQNVVKTKFNIGNSQKEKIETDQLRVANSVLIYNESFRPLQNICYVGVKEVAKDKYSWKAVLMAVIGIGLLMTKEVVGIIIGLILIVLGLYSLYSTYTNNQEEKEYLWIRLNAGDNMYFLFKDHKFLIEVMDVMINCMNKNKEYTIDMSNSSIQTCNFNERFFN